MSRKDPPKRLTELHLSTYSVIDVKRFWSIPRSRYLDVTDNCRINS